MHQYSSRSKALFMSGMLATFACSSGEEASVEPKPSGPEPDVHYVVTLAPKRDTLPIGVSRMLTARVVDGAGTPQTVVVQWSSTQPSVASVAAGNVTAVSAGSAEIIARYGSAADTATVVVTSEAVHLQVWPSAISASLGDTVGFRAQLVTASGIAVSDQAVSWTASDSQAVSLVGGGQVELRGVGDVDVTARFGELTATAAVNIFANAVGSVTITPSSASVPVGASVDLDALVLDQNGRNLWIRKVTWTTSDSAVAKIDRFGKVSGISRGGVIVTATSGGVSGTATVNVASQTASSVTLTINPDTIVAGYHVQAVATPRDASGKPITGRTIAYQSSNPAVATVNSSGAIVGIVPGSTNISAICDGNIATVALLVQSQRVTSVAVVPGAPSVQRGATATLVANVKDQLGQSMPNAAVNWTAGVPSIATISAAGVVTGVDLGTGKVTATSAGVSSQADVTVTTQVVTSVQVSPSAATILVNQASTLVATGFSATGQPITGAVFTWSVANTAIASVSQLGEVTGNASGSTTVTATSGGVSASATITVAQAPPVPVASVTVAVNSSSLNVGQATQAIATLFDAAGNVLTGRPVTWASASAALATVSASGLIVAVAPGSVTISATAEGVTGLATVTVATPPSNPVASVTVTAPASTLPAGLNSQLTVVLKDAQGTVLSGRSIAYSSSNTLFATVSSTGLVHGVSAGTVTISVTSGGVTGTIAITVQAAPPPATAYSVTVTVNASLLLVGQTTQATAVVKDSLGNPMSGQVVTWSTSNAAVATVSSTGLVTAVGAGTVAISASCNGKTGSSVMSVTAQPPVVASVAVTMSSTALTVGQSLQSSAVARDALGNTVPGVSFTWSVSSTSILGVSAGGMVSAVASGTAQVQATGSGVTGSLTVTVAASAPPPGPNGLTAPAALPQVYLNFPYQAATGSTITVLAGGNLQSAINSAQRGDEIVLSAGATFTGNFTLPAKSGTLANGWITIRSDKLSQLPAEGTRVTSANASLMPKIVTPNSAPAVATQLSASGYRIVGVEITAPAAYTGPQYGLVWLGDGSSVQNSLAQVATDLVLDRVYVHGQANTDLSRCVSLNSARTQITDSYLSECHAHGIDSQAIQGFNGPGPYKIVNNTLIGATENIMFGGADPWITGMIPRDIEIRRNYLYTPASWKGSWLKKNLFELKVGQRILIEGNVLDGSWVDGQTGWAFMLKTENQSGRCTWCTTSDVTIRYNYIRNAGAGIAISGKEGSSPNPVGALAARFSVQNNVMDNINVGIFNGDARFVQVVGNAQDVEVTNNTTTSTGYMGTFLFMDTYPTATRLAYNKNATTLAAYGMLATGRGEGTPALAAVDGGWQFNTNYLIGASRTGYPAGTTFVASLAAVPSGFGADQGTVNTKIAGVIIP